MKKCKTHCDVETCFMCKSCVKEWHAAIHAHRKTYQVKKGERIIDEGAKVTGVYFVFEGVVKVHKKWGDKELIVRFANKGAIIGHRGLGSHNTVYPISATALENSVICFIDIDFFNTTLKVNHQFTYDLMLFFADELQESERKMRNLAHMPVKGRVAQALFNLEEQFGGQPDGELNMTLSRQDLASFSGATYETVFRTINELVESGILLLNGKKIIIKNRNLLRALTVDGNL